MSVALDLVMLDRVPRVLALYRPDAGQVIGWVLALPNGSAYVLRDQDVIRARDLETVAGRWASLTDSVLVWVAATEAT